MNVGEFFKVFMLVLVESLKAPVKNGDSAGVGGKRKTVDAALDSVFAQPVGENPFASIPDPNDTRKAPKQTRTEQGPTMDDILESSVPVEPLNAKNVRKLVSNLEKAIAKNQKMRMKHADQPEKFMESEMELEEEIRSLMQLAAFPQFYGILVEMKIIPSIVALLTHENTDIVSSALQLIQELTDDQVIASDADPSVEEILVQFVDSLCQEQVLEILYNDLDRLNEENPEDAQGVFTILSIIENIVSLKPETSVLLCKSTEILSWLTKRIKVKEFTANKQYASEIMAILLQSSPEIHKLTLDVGLMDALLECLAAFRKKDPEDDDWLEFMENLFDSLCALLSSSAGKQAFVNAEGVELSCLMLKQKKMSGVRALKVMSYCLSGLVSTGVSEAGKRFLDNFGLKYVSSALGKKNVKSFKKDYPKVYSESSEEEYVLTIISSLYRHLDNSAPEFFHTRLTDRLTGDDFEKFKRILVIFKKNDLKLRKWIGVENTYEQDLVEMGLEAGTDEFMESLYLRRLENGLFALQLSSLIILDVIVGASDQLRDDILKILKEESISNETVKDALEEYMLNIGESQEDGGSSSRAEKLRVVKHLQTLIPSYFE